MADIRLFIDFGSTFTKVAAFDMANEVLLARVQSPSTVDSDVTVGLRNAISLLQEHVPVTEMNIKNAIACSSAAGGLRMVCIGLVPEYTTEAGRLAALGAGAKVIGTFSYELSRSEARSIDSLSPDIVLLTGGTDGGNKKTICHNAEVLSAIPSVSNVIVAGNKSAHDEIHDIFDGTGKNIIFTKNVMPEFGKLDLDPVNEKIRELFISRITDAKGISTVKELIGDVIMPTPSAVLAAAELIADGITGLYNGSGELMLVDVGGATTDVYSIASGVPSRIGVTPVGLPEPYAKRTVEGDLGLYHNLDTLAELAGKDVHMSGEEWERFQVQVETLRSSLSVPEEEKQRVFQQMLTRLAVRTAADRHAGRCDPIMTGNGEVWIQRGKDLSKVKLLIGAGGPVVYSGNPRLVMSGATAEADRANILKPISPRFVIDEKYILFAIGLMSRSEPEKALRIIRKYLKEV